MTVKARWFNADAIPAAPAQDVRDVGKPILLRGEQQLNERLIALVNAESDLFNQGISCAIRDRPDTTCCSCPVAGVNAELRNLCDVGQEQERTLTAIAVQRLQSDG